jgi:hypothetical protein
MDTQSRKVTLTGKILVFVNLVLALGMCVWAFALYSGRIDWSNKPAKGSEPPGELAKRLATLKQVDSALQTAETRQRDANKDLRTLEPRRPRDTAFFGQQLRLLETGINQQNPAQVVDIQKGIIELTPDGLVKMIPSPKPFESLDVLAAQQKQTQEALLASITEYQNLVELDIKLIDSMSGEKGFRQRLFNEEEVKQARIKQEIEDLKPLYINVMVELQLLNKRQRALEARVKEFDVKAGR